MKFKFIICFVLVIIGNVFSVQVKSKLQSELNLKNMNMHMNKIKLFDKYRLKGI